MSLLIILVVVSAFFAVTFFLQNKKLKAINQQLTVQLREEAQARQKDAWRVSHGSGRGKCLDLHSLPCGLRFVIRHAFYDHQSDYVYLVLDCDGHITWRKPRILKVLRTSFYTLQNSMDTSVNQRVTVIPYTFILHRCDIVEVGLKPDEMNEKVFVVTKGSLPEEGLPPSRVRSSSSPVKVRQVNGSGAALAA
ncbi:MAG: hypothetical protein QG568_601 [Patescibacteria group bacterium]|nr:hypothetical protein [Patescibacteria group bacterium]